LSVRIKAVAALAVAGLGTVGALGAQAGTGQARVADPTAAVAAKTSAAAFGTAARTARANANHVEVVVDHLNNPRGLEFGDGGVLYLAEAGAAGTNCLDEETCFGFTGSIDKIVGHTLTRIATNLISAGGRDGSFVTGVDDVGVQSPGRIFSAVTSAGPDPLPPIKGAQHAGNQLGFLVRTTKDSGVHKVADIDDIEFNQDPDGQGVDSDPYGVAVVGPGHVLVTDAAGNDLIEVDHGAAHVLAVFPNNDAGAQSVPTSVVVGPDGNYYVGEFGGEEPATPNGGSRVWKVTPSGEMSVFATDLTAITGLAFGPDGSLYVCEFSADRESGSPAGDIVRIWPDGHRTVLGAGSLFFPGGVAVKSNGAVFVSNWSILPANTDPAGPFGGANGQVVKIK
jgi:sugar lactone lactonase YvrE